MKASFHKKYVVKT